MLADQLVWWLMTGAVGGLAIVLWTMHRSTSSKLDALTALVTIEIRALSERLVRVETKLWPDSRPPHL
jgi:hypothetical protein